MMGQPGENVMNLLWIIEHNGINNAVSCYKEAVQLRITTSSGNSFTYPDSTTALTLIKIATTPKQSQINLIASSGLALN